MSQLIHRLICKPSTTAAAALQSRIVEISAASLAEERRKNQATNPAASRSSSLTFADDDDGVEGVPEKLQVRGKIKRCWWWNLRRRATTTKCVSKLATVEAEEIGECWAHWLASRIDQWTLARWSSQFGSLDVCSPLGLSRGRDARLISGDIEICFS